MLTCLPFIPAFAYGEVAALVVHSVVACSAWFDAPRSVFAFHAVLTRCRQALGSWHHGRSGRLRETVLAAHR